MISKLNDKNLNKFEQLQELITNVLENDHLVTQIKRDLTSQNNSTRDELRSRKARFSADIQDYKKKLCDIKNKLLEKKKDSQVREKNVTEEVIQKKNFQRKEREADMALRKLRVQVKKDETELEYLQQGSLQKLEELENQICEMESRVEELKETLKQLEKQKKQTKITVSKQEEEYIERSQRIRELQRQITAAGIYEKNLNLQICKRREEMNKVNKCLSEINQQLGELQKKFQKLQRSSGSNKSQLIEIKGKLSDKEKQKKKFNYEKVSLQEKLEQAKDRQSCLGSTEKRLWKKKKNIILTIDEIEEKIFKNKMFDVYCNDCDQVLEGTCSTKYRNSSANKTVTFNIENPHIPPCMSDGYSQNN